MSHLPDKIFASRPRPASVLIVEDELLVAKDLEQTLLGLGYAVTGVTTSAEQALGNAATRVPDVVLMDIRIEGAVDGIHTAALLKQLYDVSVIYLTSHADDATIERAKRTEPHAYLVKPVLSDELRSAIEVALYRHQIERRLRERESWFATTLGSIADAVISVDVAGTVTFINRAAEALTNTAARTALGTPLRDVLRKAGIAEQPGEHLPIVTALQESRRVEPQDPRRVRAPTGEQRLIHHVAAPVIHEGQTLGAVMVLHDVTDQTRLKKQLELANHMASLGTLAAGVAHEINNPLAVVSGNAEYLAEELERRRAAQGSELAADPRFEEIATALHDLRGAASRIARVIADLRMFSRPPAHGSGTVDVLECLQWALRIAAHEVQLRARVVTDLGALPPVRADQSKLSQVFVHLLVAAAHAFVPGHADQNCVTVTARTDERGWALIEIRANGSHLLPTALDDARDPLHTSAPDAHTSLGLSLSQGIVVGLGGALQVRNEHARGVLFAVALPAEPR